MSLRIATYNVGSLLALGEKDDHLELGPRSFGEKCAGIAGMVDRIDPDLLVLQEVVSDEGIEGILAAADVGSALRVLGVGEAGSRGIRTWLLGRAELAISAQTEALDDGLDVIRWGGAPLLRKNSIVYSQVPVDKGVTLHMIGLHLKSKRASDPTGEGPFEPRSAAEWAHGSLFSTTRRMVQAVKVREIVDEILDRDQRALVCVAGDFNEGPYSPPLEAIRGAHRWLDNCRSRQLTASSTALPIDRRFTYVHYGNPVLLDDILLSPSLWKRRIETDVLGNGDLGSPDAPSDHAPMVADFDF